MAVDRQSAMLRGRIRGRGANDISLEALPVLTRNPLRFEQQRLLAQGAGVGRHRATDDDAGGPAGYSASQNARPWPRLQMRCC